MRVLHVVPAVAARYGGPSAAALGMCRALDQAGVETIVATTDADGPGRLAVDAGRVQRFDDVQTIFFRRHFGEAYKWSRGLSRWLQEHVADFDVVHVHAVFSHASIVGGQAALRRGIPYIVRPLGTLDPWSLSSKPARKRLLLRLGAGGLLRAAARMHYTSDEEERLAETAVPSVPEGVVIPLGIDELFFRGNELSGTRPERPYVLCVSRFHEKKGLDLLIRAFRSVAADVPFQKWHLVLAGDGDPTLVSRLKALAGDDDLASRIEFRGWVDGDEKLQLVRGASLFALPSHQENFGISMIEAMASGIPVIVTPGVNFAADIDRAVAGWVTAREDRALADTLRAAMQNPDERAHRGCTAARFAARFRWAAVASDLADLYGTVTRQASAAVHG